MAKWQDKKFKSFENKHLKFLWKHFAENEKEKIFPFEKCQNKYYPDNLNFISFCRRTSLHVLMFPISVLKSNLSSYWKWQTLKEKSDHFSWRQK